MARTQQLTATGDATARADFTPKRGRPTVRQIEAIEQVIVEVARRQFLEQGFATTSMEAVAAEAGISKGTLYARYPTKAALFGAIVERCMASWTFPVIDTVHDDAEAILRHYSERFFESVRRPDMIALNRMMTAEAARFPDLARRYHDEGYEGGVDRLARDLRRWAAREGVALADPWGVATAFIATLAGWIRKETLSHLITETECRAFADSIIRIFTQGRAGW